MDQLEHYGVKGMKWGVRRSQATLQKKKGFKGKTKYGDSIAATPNPTPKLAKFVAKYSRRARENIDNTTNLTLKDSSGKNVGDMQLYKESKNSLNVTWVTVGDSQRGKGYGTAAMKGAIKHAKKEGLEKVTLEVPGTSPDARHIYERLGFKAGKQVSGDDDGWGGLTEMELNLNDIKQNDQVGDFLEHYGVKGMKWGVIRSKEQLSKARSSVKEKVRSTTFATAAKINPRELKYTVKRTFSKSKPEDEATDKRVKKESLEKGYLTTNEADIAAVNRQGVQAHKNAKYDNLNDKDIMRLKKYTDSAAYSRAINGHLAIGEPPHVAPQAKKLKDTLSKNKINDQTFYRSTALKFSTDGLAKKIDTHGEDALAKTFDKFDRNFKGKSFKENRVYSTSTSPSFAIDTWRKVNPNAAKTYNSYLVINAKGTPGVLADGRTSKGKKLVNTRSNQEGILAPNKMTYKKLAWDPDREMFAVHMDAE